MPLSISSFEHQIPNAPWRRIIGTALLICFACVALMEIRLAQLGYLSTILDSSERWGKERDRASQLGKRALILVGGSRIQLGIDLDILRKETGLEPVQLALDGSSFVPILKGLADDPTIRGTVLVDYYPESVAGALSGEYGAADIYERAFVKRSFGHAFFSLDRLEKSLTEMFHENLRSFADGATPLMSLQWRIIPNEKASQYLITLPDRSRLADYSLVAMPEFYYKRVARNLGQEQTINLAAADIEQVLKRQIKLQQPGNNTAYVQGARYLRQLIASINLHGGKVLFVAMPTSGMIHEIDEKRYPRANFLDIFEKEAGVSVLSSVDDPALRSFACPDGSHLDLRDRQKFTAALVHSLGIGLQKAPFESTPYIMTGPSTTR